MSEIVTTVSPTYAKEICRPEFGYGLDPALQARGDALVGILNGVDTTEWNPATDVHLPVKYSLETVKEGKAACKAALQREMGLPQKPDAMLLGVVSRLTDQKGLGLIAARASELFRADIQFVVLGNGEMKYENWLQELKSQFPTKVAAAIGFNETLAHRIEAGIDAFLMPSQFERAASIRCTAWRTGPRRSSATSAGWRTRWSTAHPSRLPTGPETASSSRSTRQMRFLACVWRAVGVFQHDRPLWNRLIKHGMSRDWSWTSSAQEYVKAYDNARSRVK